MAGTVSKSCSVRQWGINFTGCRLQLVHKSARQAGQFQRWAMWAVTEDAELKGAPNQIR